MKPLTVLLLLASGCSGPAEIFLLEKHKEAIRMKDEQAIPCYEISQPTEISGKFCIKYIGPLPSPSPVASPSPMSSQGN